MTNMPFGKHKGEPIDELPDGYICWLLTIELREPLRSAVENEAHTRGLDTSGTRCAIVPPAAIVVARRLVDVGYRRLAVELHPDKGGSTEAMVQLNAAVEALREALR